MPSFDLHGQNGIRGPRLISNDVRRCITPRLCYDWGVLLRLAGPPVESPVAVFATKGPQQHRTEHQINHSVTVGTMYVLASATRAKLRYP
jgi:hypothetical protein